MRWFANLSSALIGAVRVICFLLVLGERALVADDWKETTLPLACLSLGVAVLEVTHKPAKLHIDRSRLSSPRVSL